MNRDAFFDDGPPISQLQAAAKGLERLVHVLVPRISKDAPAPSASSTSRRAPTAAQLFGQQPFVSAQWRGLPSLSVAVYGLNAVGARAAEALARAGIGKLLLVDAPQNSVVTRESLCAMAFEREEVGFSRTQALRLRLQSVDVEGGDRHHTGVEAISIDVTHAPDRLELQKKLKMSKVGRVSSEQPSSPDDTGQADEENHPTPDFGLFEALTLKHPYDAVLCCSEDAAAKRALNELCLELSLPMIDIEISLTNTSISVHTVLPGATCCLECIKAARALTPMDQVVQSLASVFPAVLPHVEITAAGFAAQQVLKYVATLKLSYIDLTSDVSLHY